MSATVISILSRHWRVGLVAALLLLVAAVQVTRAVVLDQSSWIGGGFGMFATYDYDDTRRVVAFWRSGEELVPASLVGVSADEILRVRVVPSEEHLRRMGERALAANPPPEGMTVDALVLEVRGRDLDGNVLTVTVLASVEVPTDPGERG